MTPENVLMTKIAEKDHERTKVFLDGPRMTAVEIAQQSGRLALDQNSGVPPEVLKVLHR